MFDYKNLISKELSLHNSEVLSNSDTEILTYYIHLNSGWEIIEGSYVDWNGEKINQSENILIKSAGHSLQDISFIQSIFERLDPLIDIDFEEMFNFNGSTIDIYSIDSSTSFLPNALGQAITRSSNYGSWWEILWKDTDGKIRTNLSDENTIIHEIGHVLGLSHPQDDLTHDTWDTFDTVMSYNVNEEGWNNWFTQNDIFALQKIWGRENDNNKVNYHTNSYKYKLKKDTNNNIFIITELGYEDISHLDEIIFLDKTFNINSDIRSIYNQVINIDDITGQIFRLYGVFLNRFPDVNGFNYWINEYEEKVNSVDKIIKSFLNSDEFKQRFNTVKTNEEYIETIYNEVLNREYDIEGYSYWIKELNNNSTSRNKLIENFFHSSESKTQYIDLLGFNDKSIIDNGKIPLISNFNQANLI